MILKTNKKQRKHTGLEPKFWIDPTRMSLLLRNLMWLKRRSWQKTIKVNRGRQSKCGMSLKTERDQGRHKGLEPKIQIPPSRMSLLLGRLMWLKRRNLQNMIQVNQGRTRTTHSRVWGCFNGGSFSLELELGEVTSILCTRIFTEKGVGVLQLWLFLSGVRTQRSQQYFMYTDIHRKRGWGCFHCGYFSLE